MSSRTLTRLLIVAGVLVGLWLVVTLISRRPAPEPPGRAEWAAFLSGLTPATVTTVTMEDSAGTRVLTAEDGGWRIDGFATDSSVVARFWSALGEASAVTLAATNPENHDRMGVAEDSTVTVTFQTADGSTTLLVGNAGAAPGTLFVRRPGEDEVYLVDGGLRVHFVRSVGDWREKRMLRLDTAAVRTIAVQIPGDSYTLTRQDTAWTVDGERASTFRVTSILEELAGFRGVDFLVPGDSMYALEPAITVTALDAAGDTMTVLNLSEGERDRRGTVRGDSIVYRVPNFRIDRVAPSRQAITAPPS